MQVHMQAGWAGARIEQEGMHDKKVCMISRYAYHGTARGWALAGSHSAQYAGPDQAQMLFKKGGREGADRMNHTIAICAQGRMGRVYGMLHLETAECELASRDVYEVGVRGKAVASNLR